MINRFLRRAARWLAADIDAQCHRVSGPNRSTRPTRRGLRTYLSPFMTMDHLASTKLDGCRHFLTCEALEPRLALATLGLGDVGFTGFQSVTPDKVSLVLLKDVDSGTVLTVTDNGWNGSALSSNEGNSVITFNAAFAAGTQINYDANRTIGQRWAVGSSTANISDNTGGVFSLAAGGDNLFVYSGSTAPPSGTSTSWVAAFATNPFQTTGAATSTQSYLPAVFAGTDAQLSLGISVGANNENGAYTAGNITGSVAQIRATVHNAANWTTFTSAGAQAIPPNATFTIQDTTNRAPVDLQLSNNTLVENGAANAVVGAFATIDPDAGNTFTYTLVAGTGSTDNDKFNINGIALRASSSLDFETQNRFSIRVRTTDQGGLFFEQAFGIQLFDANESAQATLRLVSYNIASSSNGGTPRTGLDTILNGIASEIVVGIARPIDLLALQEVASQATTSAIVAAQLNTRYGTTTYASGTLDGGTTGSGTQGIVYNTQTLQLLDERLIGSSSTTGQPRHTIRYRLQPVGGVAGSDFYLYNSHWKSADDIDSRNRRLLEAQAIRADADLLAEGSNIFYVGDFNVYSGSEAAFQQMIGAGSGQALDPINRIGSWSNNASYLDTFTQAPAAAPPSGLTGGGLDDRFDFQLMSGELFDGLGLEYRSGTYHAFGNNASVAMNNSINDPGSTALADLFDRSLVLDLLTTVTDHLPVVADTTFIVDSLINHAPAGGDTTVTTNENQTYTFVPSDFSFSDPDDSPPDAFDAVKVATLPTVGSLSLNGQAVSVGQIITTADIAAGSLRFAPPANAWGSPLTSFTFQVRDNGGTAFGGVDIDSSPNALAIRVIPTPGITVSSPNPTTTTEAGGTASFSIVLDSPPTANVTIAVSSSDTTEGVASPASIVFTSANWNQAQSVTVTGVDDSIDDGDVAYSIILGVANSTDPAYNGLDAADVTLTNIDNDDAPSTKFFVVNDGSPDRTFEYDASGVAVENYTIASTNSLPRGIVASADGKTLWTVDRNRTVFVYNDAGQPLGSWTAGTISTKATVEGIATDGINIWIVDSTSDRVYYYSGAASRRDGSQNASSSFALASGNTNPKDLAYGKDTTGAGLLWVVNDAATDRVFRYGVNSAGGISLLNSWVLSSSNKTPTGITLDPSATSGDIWIVDNGTTKQVFRYANGRTLATPGGSVAFVLSAANSNPQGIADPPPTQAIDAVFAEWKEPNNSVAQVSSPLVPHGEIIHPLTKPRAATEANMGHPRQPSLAVQTTVAPWHWNSVVQPAATIRASTTRGPFTSRRSPSLVDLTLNTKEAWTSSVDALWQLEEAQHRAE